jgi:hypothetical protein
VPRRALFIVSVYQFSHESFPLLVRFRDAGFDVHVVAGWSGDSADEYIRRCGDAGFGTHRPPVDARYGDYRFPQGPRPAESAPSRVGPVRALRRRIGLTLYDARIVVRALRRFGMIKRFSTELFDNVDPDVVLAGPYHSCGKADEGIAKLATRRKIPYCCYSVRPYLGERYAISTRFSDADRSRLSSHVVAENGLLNRLLARVFPSWTRTLDGLRLFPFDPRFMLAAKLSGLLPRNPWQQPSELFDLCLVESDLARDLLVESGYDLRKIAVTGKPVLDEVLEHASNPQRETETRRELGLAEHEAFVLCNIEPTAEHDYVSWDEHWRRLRSLMEALTETRLPIVLSLHPLCEPHKYEWIETEFGFRFAGGRSMLELIPYCTVVVSYPSSLNPTVVSLGKPLVVYDFLGSTRAGQPGADLYRLPSAPIVYDSTGLGPLVVELARSKPSAAVAEHTSAGERSVDAVIERFGLADG